MDTDLFETAPVPRAYFAMTLPLVLSMTMTLVYNVVDTYFIAHTGNEAMIAGVAVAGPMFTLMIALGDIFGLGGASLVSRLFGAGRIQDCRRVSAFCWWAALGFGVLVAVVLLLAEDPVLRLLGARPDTWQQAAAYYRWIAIGSPAIIVQLTPSNLLRTQGFARPAMIGSIAGTVVNIVLNPLLISTAGWGAAGSAIATVVGNLVAAAYFTWFTLVRADGLSVDPRLALISRREVGQVLWIGLPAATTNIMQTVGIVLVNRYLLAHGTGAIAAMGIALKAVMIAVLVIVGFSFGAQPLFGYAYGARNIARLRAFLRFAYVFETSLAVVMGVLLALPARSLMRFFVDDPSLVSTGAWMLRIQVLSLPFATIVMVTTCVFQSMGRGLAAFAMSACRQGVFLVLALEIGSRAFGYTGVVAAQPVADTLTALMGLGIMAVIWRVLVRGATPAQLGREH